MRPEGPKKPPKSEINKNSAKIWPNRRSYVTDDVKVRSRKAEEEVFNELKRIWKIFFRDEFSPLRRDPQFRRFCAMSDGRRRGDGGSINLRDNREKGPDRVTRTGALKNAMGKSILALNILKFFKPWGTHFWLEFAL